MKVIFLDNVPGVAIRGDVKNVKPGFFRNYLFPQRKAVMATAPALKQWEGKRQKMLIVKKELAQKLGEITRRLSTITLTIQKKVTAKGTLYGGVKSVDLAKTIMEQFNIEVPAYAIKLPSNIKTVGTYEAVINLGDGAETKLSFAIAEKK